MFNSEHIANQNYTYCEKEIKDPSNLLFIDGYNTCNNETTVIDAAMTTRTSTLGATWRL